MQNVLTVDVEDYYMVSAFADIVKFEDWPKYESRVEVNTKRVLELLNEYDVKATFFVLGWVAEHYPALVREIHQAGHEIASHGYNHRLAYDLSPDEFRNDTRKAKVIIEDVIGEPIYGYRATSYSITERNLWALDILIEEGFRYDSSIFPIHHDRYGYPGFSRFPVTLHRNGIGEILEIPLSTIRFIGRNIPIAGGGYLRLLPIRFIELGIRILNLKETRHAVVYFHPWEIDAEQPKLNGSGLSNFRHSINIHKTVPKIKKLLQDFRFGPINKIFNKDIQWQHPI